MAKVKTTNQEFPIPNDWVVLVDESQEAKNQRDTRIRRLLSSYIPSITNAQLSYSQEGEETVVRVTPQLGTKGLTDPVLPSFFSSSGMHCDLSDVQQALRDAPPYFPPLLKLAWELKWLMLNGKLSFERLIAYQPILREVLEQRAEISLVEHLHQRLRDLPPVASPIAPLGF